VEFLTQRLSIDDNLIARIRLFVELQSDADLTAVHETVCIDLDLQQLGIEYGELVDSDIILELRNKTLHEV